MKNIVTGAIITTGLLAAGVVGYCFVNRGTKYQADKLLNTVMSDATNKINKMSKKEF